MDASKKKMNNRGATLVLVLVCMLFVGIIASAILVLVSSNLEVSNTEKRINATFYNAEGAADQVKALLQEYANKAMNSAYTKWLQQYSLGEKDAGAVYDSLFANEMLDVLEQEFFILTPAGTPTITYDTDEEGNITQQTRVYDRADIDLPDLINLIGDSHAEWVNDTDPITVVLEKDGEVRIKDVAIKYTDADGNMTMVTTDIVFIAETPKFLVNTLTGQNLNIAEYVLISNGEISNTSGDYDVAIEGNVYSGNNISFGNIVKVNSDYLVAKKDLIIEDRGNIVVEGDKPLYGGSPDDNRLWTNNIVLGKNASMSIKGSTYLADDLTLDDGASFTMSGTGASTGFYGYNPFDAKNIVGDSSIVNKFGTPGGSSAIVINGKNAELNLSSAKNVWIAGKAFIDINTVHKEVSDESEYSYSKVAFPEGESIALKGQQAAYLLPGECIPSIGHNPMTRDEFFSLYTVAAANRVTTSGNFTYESITDIDPAKVELDPSLNSFVDSAIPYRPAFIIYGGTRLVYLYLNFKDIDAASAYFKAYSELHADIVSGRMSSFGTEGRIILPTGGTVVNSGNIMAYNGTDLTVSGSTLSYGYAGGTSGLSMAIQKQGDLYLRFNGLCTGLNEKYAGNGAQVTDNLMNMNLLTETGVITTKKSDGTDDFTLTVAPSLKLTAAGGAGDSYNTTSTTGVYSFNKTYKDDDHDGRNDDLNVDFYTSDRYSNDVREKVDKYKLFVAKGNVEIEGNGKGIVICGGNVKITGTGSDGFTGLIIAGGKIMIDGDSNYKADPIVISAIMRNSKLMAEIFDLNTATNVAEEGGKLVSGLITINFENWRKN